MTANLVVRYDCNEYVVTYGPKTKALVGRRRDVELHRWADGSLEIHWQGKSLPYVIQRPKPLVSPGEMVERKRVAEVMTSITAVQEDPGRHRRAAARQLRVEIAPTPRPARRRAPEPPPKPTATQLEDVDRRTRFTLQWRGRQRVPPRPRLHRRRGHRRRRPLRGAVSRSGGRKGSAAMGTPRRHHRPTCPEGLEVTARQPAKSSQRPEAPFSRAGGTFPPAPAAAEPRLC
jgi:hypothetical protein